MEISRIKVCYGRLKGIQSTLHTQDHCTSDVVRNYNKIIAELTAELPAKLDDFVAPQSFIFQSYGGEMLCQSERLLEKINELLSFLEYGYGVHNHVVKIGSLYNAIQNPELKERCSDILSAAGNFDRVVNQATQVLEDRIRRLSDGDRNTVGVALISTAFTADPSTSKLVMSEHRDEQEGLFHVLRGIMIGFRNPTHHHLTSSITREHALKICVFIDFLLGVLAKATIKKA